MKELAERFGLAFLAEPWLPKALLAILATVVLNFVADRLLNRLSRMAQRTSNT